MACVHFVFASGGSNILYHKLMKFGVLEDQIINHTFDHICCHGNCGYQIMNTIWSECKNHNT